MRLTDDDLREAARDDLDMTGTHAAMARELLAARRVVEAARELDRIRTLYMVPSEAETEAAARVAHVLVAYDREVSGD